MSENSRKTNPFTQGVKKLAVSAAKATKRAGRMAKLNIDIASEKDNAKRLYADVGRLYYEAHRGEPEGFFVQLFQQIDASMEAIEAMQAELRSLRSDGEPDDADIEVEIELEADDAPAETPKPEPEPEAPPESE